MNQKQNPFSLYDFLGYFTPGALLLYMTLLAWGHVRSDSPAIGMILRYLSFDRPELYIPFVIASYVAGHFISFISSITIEKYAVWQFGYPSKYLLGIKHDGYLHVNEQKALRAFIRILVWLLIAPISLLDFFLGKILGMRDLYTKGLDSLLAAALQRKTSYIITKEAGIKDPGSHGSPKDHDFFRYVYHYAIEHSPNHFQKMQNYVALYGLLRTITLILVIFFWVLVWHAHNTLFSVAASAWLLWGTAIVAYFFFMAFVKFYRRFSLEALMAMAVVCGDKEKSRKKARG